VIFGLSNAEESQASPHPLGGLPREDLDLIAELVLNSGSLKDLASVYGVSYPTIRGRLDKVIERLRAAVEGRARDPVSELLASLVERGELTASAARAIRELVRRQVGEAGSRGAADGERGGRGEQT
jgi:hypothetical protein